MERRPASSTRTATRFPCPTRFRSLATIAVVIGLMDMALPLAPLLAAVAVLAAINGVSLLLLRRRRAVTNAELTAALLFDVAALAWQLHHSGGLTNPIGRASCRERGCQYV